MAIKDHPQEAQREAPDQAEISQQAYEEVRHSSSGCCRHRWWRAALPQQRYERLVLFVNRLRAAPLVHADDCLHLRPVLRTVELLSESHGIL